ncbi:hypothetical protein [Bilophila sp.]|uniref:hypothetical protein n=1 Tax=Bilophila sp. TaxID=1929485 RepID=UPI003076ED78
MVVSSPQHGEKTGFFSSFPLGWIHSRGVFLVIHLEFQGKKHQPFSGAQPFAKETEATLPTLKVSLDSESIMRHFIVEGKTQPKPLSRSADPEDA